MIKCTILPGTLNIKCPVSVLLSVPLSVPYQCTAGTLNPVHLISLLISMSYMISVLSVPELPSTPMLLIFKGN